MFGFVEQNQNSILETTTTLELLTKFQTLNIAYFFDIMQELNLNTTVSENKYSKYEFYTIDSIVIKIFNAFFSLVSSYFIWRIKMNSSKIKKCSIKNFISKLKKQMFNRRNLFS